MRFIDYCNQICKIAHFDQKAKMKIAFGVFDYDSDGKIGVDDVMKVMEELKPTDWLIMED
jgi:Ca2+-binding EF-hand superfamily protein